MRSQIGLRNNGLVPRLRPRSVIEPGTLSSTNSKSGNSQIQKWATTIEELAGTADRDFDRAADNHDSMQKELRTMVEQLKEVRAMIL